MSAFFEAEISNLDLEEPLIAKQMCQMTGCDESLANRLLRKNLNNMSDAINEYYENYVDPFVKATTYVNAVKPNNILKGDDKAEEHDQTPIILIDDDDNGDNDVILCKTTSNSTNNNSNKCSTSQPCSSFFLNVIKPKPLDISTADDHAKDSKKLKRKSDDRSRIKNKKSTIFDMHDELQPKKTALDHTKLCPKSKSLYDSGYCDVCNMVQHQPYLCNSSLFQGNVVDKLDGFQVLRINPNRFFNPDDFYEKEYRIAEGQFLRMQAATLAQLEISSIDLVTNKKLQEKFEEKKMALSNKNKDVQCLLLFHGTPQSNIISILKNNFDLSIITNGRAYGHGVYFSECPEVSLGYSRDRGSLILCQVLRTKKCKEVQKDASNRFWAIVVPDTDLILPKYVINFKLRGQK